MSTRKKVTLVMEAVDNFSSPLKDVASATRGYGKIAKKVTEQQRSINKKIGDISAYKKLNKSLDDTGYNLKTASRRSIELAKKIQGIKRPTALMSREFKTAKRAEDALRKSHTKQSTSLNKLQRDLTEAKIDTNNLTKASKLLERQQTSVNRKIKFGKAADRISNGVSSGATKARNIAGKAAATGAVAFGAIGYFIKTQFVDTASQFEKFETVLTNAEGSLVKAKKSMAWIKEFGASTPYEIDGVTEAFVSLRSKGIDPTDGLLRTLGDTAASMDKPLMQAVEAILDARTGELERLKELGITSSKSGDQITFEYTNKAGEQLTKTVNKKNRKMIQDTLVTIWDEKFGGSMDALSKTWAGMLSNMSDHWKNFILLVMEEGLFDRMKNSLRGLLDKINEMAANGELKEKAREFGAALTKIYEAAGKAGKAIYQFTIWASEHTTMIGNVVKGYAVYKVVSIASAASTALFGTSLLTLSTKGIPAAIASLGKLAVAQQAASMGGAGKLGKFGKLGVVGLAGAGGYAVGTKIHEKLIGGTKLEDKIGSGTAHLLAALGNDEAQKTVAMSKRAKAEDEDPAVTKAKEVRRKRFQEQVEATQRMVKGGSATGSKNIFNKVADDHKKRREGVSIVETGSATHKPSNMISQTTNNTFNVTASPGMNEEQLAKKVAIEIAKENRKAESRVAYDR